MSEPSTEPQQVAADTRPAGIDPRGPRFGAGITAALLLIIVVLGVAGASTAAFWLLVAATALFAWGAFAGIRRHPYGILFAKLVRPRLAPPAELEDPRPPTFAQGVGFAVGLAGVLLAASRPAVRGADRRGHRLLRGVPQRRLRILPRLPDVPAPGARPGHPQHLTPGASAPLGWEPVSKWRNHGAHE